MKTNFTLLILLFSFQLANSQGVFNENFTSVETVNCPYDSTTQIELPKYWEIYQTLNGEWDGPIDSTRCIGVTDEGFWSKIELNQIDPTLPLFIKNKPDNIDATRLYADVIFRASGILNASEGVNLNLEEDCGNNLCSGLLVGLEIPDSVGQEKVLRENRGTFISTFNGGYEFGLCYPTEKFDTTYLKEFILKFTFTDSLFTDEWISIDYVSNWESEPAWGDYRIYDIVAQEWAYQDTSYNLDLQNVANGYMNFLLMYTDSTYPAPENLSYIDARPAMNQSTPQTVNLFINSEQTLVIQPYARIQGGLVDGSDSIRHEFNLINDGGDICFEEFLEVNFPKSNTYYHKAGNINFHGVSSCMMFRYGGQLKVGQGAYLQYGDGGEGILALGSKARVDLESGSTLAIDNRVVLLDKGYDFDNQVKIDLQPGSALIFEANSKILRADGDQSNQMINVYMNGGLLDDHRLSDAERMMINKIYPEEQTAPYPELAGITVYPNPAKEVMTCRYNSKLDQMINVEILNLKGQVVYHSSESVREGMNDLVLDTKIKTQGIFILKLNTADGAVSQKFVK